MAERRPRVPVELAERIDKVRGDVPFERWVRRALEKALSGSPLVASPAAEKSPASGSGVDSQVSASRSPASSRASVQLEPSAQQRPVVKQAPYRKPFVPRPKGS